MELSGQKKPDVSKAAIDVKPELAVSQKLGWRPGSTPVDATTGSDWQRIDSGPKSPESQTDLTKLCFSKHFASSLKHRKSFLKEGGSSHIHLDEEEEDYAAEKKSSKLIYYGTILLW